jgi:hypothetical protein
VQSTLILRFTMEAGEARGAMMAASLSQSCWALTMGVLASSICLLCALWLPGRKS